MLKIKHTSGLLWVVFFLMLKDLMVGLKQPVFFLLLMVLLIPMVLLFHDAAKKTLNNKNILLLLFLTLFYLFILPANGTGFKYFLPMIYAGYAFRNIDYKLIGKIFLIAQLFVILARMCLVHIGLIAEEIVSLDYKSASGNLYHDLGYGNPNSAGMVFFFFVVSLHLVLYKKNKWLSFVLILLVSLFALRYTASRTSFGASMLLLFTYIIPSQFLIKFFHNKWFLLSVPFLILSPLLFGGWILSSYEEINELLSNRIYIVYLLMDLFSSPISYLTGVVIEEEGIPIDNAFCYMLINYGITSIIVFAFQYINIVKQRSEISTFMLALLLIVVISGMGEASWAAFGGMGASFFWMLFFNQTYYNTIKRQA